MVQESPQTRILFSTANRSSAKSRCGEGDRRSCSGQSQITAARWASECRIVKAITQSIKTTSARDAAISATSTVRNCGRRHEEL